MGIDGKQINSAQMTARGYILTIEDSNIVMKIPIGGPDGYYKVCFFLNLTAVSLELKLMVVSFCRVML